MKKLEDTDNSGKWCKNGGGGGETLGAGGGCQLPTVTERLVDANPNGSLGMILRGKWNAYRLADAELVVVACHKRVGMSGYNLQLCQPWEKY